MVVLLALLTIAGLASGILIILKEAREGTSNVLSAGKILAALLSGGALLGLIEPPGDRMDEGSIQEIHWYGDLEEGISYARAHHRPVIIDCQAKWCAACKELEESFRDPRVVRHLRDFVLIRFDMTDFEPARKRLKALGVDVVSLPTIVFLRPDLSLWQCRITKYIPPEELLSYIEAFERGDQECPSSRDLLSQGLLYAIVLVFLAGIGVSLTPCILPVVAPAAALISGWPEVSYSLRSRILRSLTFLSGVVVMYTSLGILSGLAGWGFGSWLSNPVLDVIFGVLFILLGVSYTGLIRFDLPSSWKARLSSSSDTPVGLFLFGLGIGVLAAPCSGPVTVAIFALLAGKGNVLLGALMMFVFAVGMGLIFVILGIATSFVGLLRGKGRLAAIVEYLLMIALFSTGLYYIRLAL